MALTHRIIQHVDLPHEPGAWIEARMPSLAIKDRAREARTRRALKMIGDVDLSKLKGMTSENVTAQVPDPAAEFDSLTLLTSCIVAWSYPEPVTAENVGELDEQTVEVVVAALLPTESEADRKNASGGSTMPSTAKGPRR